MDVGHPEALAHAEGVGVDDTEAQSEKEKDAVAHCDGVAEGDCEAEADGEEQKVDDAQKVAVLHGEVLADMEEVAHREEVPELLKEAELQEVALREPNDVGELLPDTLTLGVALEVALEEAVGVVVAESVALAEVVAVEHPVEVVESVG